MAIKKAQPKKAVAKPIAKPIAKKAASKPTPVAKKVAKPAPATKKVAKPAPVAKKVAKPAPVAKKATKPAAKPVAKKVAKPAPVAKKATKPAAKPVAKKVVKPTPKPTVKKVEKPIPAAKKVVKPTPKPVAKKVEKPTPKPVAKKAEKTAPVKVTEPKKVKVIEEKVTPIPVNKKVVKPAKKGPIKTAISNSFNTLPKKSDVFKTNTFGASNLKNETGKVIAHRKTEDLKRKNNENEIHKYEPESTRSILDMNNNSEGPSYRYSDDDLQEFRELVIKKIENAKNELQYLQGVIMRKDEGGTEDTENKYQNMEDGGASMEREQFNQLASRQITFIGHLEQALVRIENKTYGICRETGKLIDKARLRAVPHATLSIEAKNAKKN